MKRKLLTLVLALLLAISLIPASVFADEPVTLKVLLVMHELTKDPSEIDLYRQIEEMANVKFEFTVVRSGWGEKKATMLASGDLPDMILSTGISDTDIAQNTEYFVPLNDYLDQMPNLTRVFEEAPELKATSTQLDGNIYSVPSQSFFGGERLHRHQQGMAGQAGAGSSHHAGRTQERADRLPGSGSQRQRHSG